MPERDHGQKAVLATRRRHPPVMVELGLREEARLGLDARPLDGEAVGVEAEAGDEPDVLEVAVVVVARVSGRLGEHRRLRLLEHPQVAVEVVALDLVRGRRDAPQEPFRIALRRENRRRRAARREDGRAGTGRRDEAGCRRKTAGQEHPPARIRAADVVDVPCTRRIHSHHRSPSCPPRQASAGAIGFGRVSSLHPGSAESLYRRPRPRKTGASVARQGASSRRLRGALAFSLARSQPSGRRRQHEQTEDLPRRRGARRGERDRGRQRTRAGTQGPPISTQPSRSTGGSTTSCPA